MINLFKKNIFYISILIVVGLTFFYKVSTSNKKQIGFKRVYNYSVNYDTSYVIHKFKKPQNIFIEEGNNNIVSLKEEGNKYTLNYFDLINFTTRSTAQFSLNENKYPNIGTNINKEDLYFFNKGEVFKMSIDNGHIEKWTYNNIKIFRFISFNNSGGILLFGQYKKDNIVKTGLFIKNKDNINSIIHENIGEDFNKNLFIYYGGLFNETDDYYTYNFFHISKIIILHKKSNKSYIINTEENINEEIPKIDVGKYYNSNMTNYASFVYDDVLYNFSSVLESFTKGIILDKYSISENKYLGSAIIESDDIINNNNISQIVFKGEDLFIVSENGIVVVFKNIKFNEKT